MKLPSGVLQDARKHRQRVADVARHPEGQVNDFSRGQLFARGRLRGIHRGRRSNHVNFLKIFLLVIHRDFQRLLTTNLDAFLVHLIKPFPLHAQPV